MTEIQPFRAFRYETRRVDLSRVLVPPYDVIAPEERVLYYDRDPHSAIRLELTRDLASEAKTDYAEVAHTLADWRRAGVLVQDPAPALYGLRQRFRTPGGETFVREGFFGALRLEEYARRIVCPHERTLAGPKADRLKILRATQANLSSVFLLYQDRGDKLAAELAGGFAQPALASATDDAGIEHSLWRFDSPALHAAAQGFLKGQSVVIADGHHRYETALTYARERHAAAGSSVVGDAPWWYTLAYFANAYAPGTLLLPIHRVIRSGPVPDAKAWRAHLPGWHEETVTLSGVERLPSLLAERLAPRRGLPAFAADDGSGKLRIFWRPAQNGEISIRVIHSEVIGGVCGLDEDAVRQGAIAYPKDAQHAARDIRAGQGVLALYLNALSPDEVFAVTAARELLPQKSTFFLPKLPTGLLFRLMAPPETLR
ncbi:MAG TPA: DUF1015 domain-containing protein [Myxococcota bacterium]|nr:DUF1015 domain-containing protein [Myxococcota bacterium]